MAQGPGTSRKKQNGKELQNDNLGLWLAPDLASRARPQGSKRSEVDLAWLRNRHHWANLADASSFAEDLFSDDIVPFRLDDEQSA